MATKPANARGTRDFDPATVRKRQYIESVIRQAYARFGYQEIQTPALEQLSVLEGKYGEEGDRLLFRILNSGDLTEAILAAVAEPSPIKALTEKGLRYDLTVPFARYVVQHQNEITFPFKRYQLQPVWRADRPQKGRYREFTQCDADVVSREPSLLHELEFLQLFDGVFQALNLRVEIQLNHRQVLAGIADVLGAPEKLLDLTVAIDKLDKIGPEGVTRELTERGFTAEQLRRAAPFFELTGEPAAVVAHLREVFAGRSETGLAGVAELETLLGYLAHTPLAHAQLAVNVTLARGLNYYTGCIFEVKSLETEIGSIASGGRYNDLTGLFGLTGIAGAGISFGLDRVYDVLEATAKWPANLSLAPVTVLVAHFEEALLPVYLPLVARLRHAGISAELYPTTKKLAKQLEYANKNGIPCVLLLGESEVQAGEATLKLLATGQQQTISLQKLREIETESDFWRLAGHEKTPS